MSARCRWWVQWGNQVFFLNLPDGWKKKRVFIDWVVSHMQLHASKLAQHQRKLVCLMSIPLGINLFFKGRFLSLSVSNNLAINTHNRTYLHFLKKLYTESLWQKTASNQMFLSLKYHVRALCCPPSSFTIAAGGSPTWARSCSSFLPVKRQFFSPLQQLLVWGSGSAKQKPLLNLTPLVTLN